MKKLVRTRFVQTLESVVIGASAPPAAPLQRTTDDMMGINLFFDEFQVRYCSNLIWKITWIQGTNIEVGYKTLLFRLCLFIMSAILLFYLFFIQMFLNPYSRLAIFAELQ